MSSRTYTLSMPDGDVPVTVTERGAVAPVVLLHGGAGPDSFAGFGDELAARFPVRVLTPVHPGFGGTPRPEGLDSIRKLAEVYARLLAELDLTLVSARGTLVSAQGTLGNASNLTAPNSAQVQQLDSTLQEVSRAARSVRVLSDYLERHPEALLRGKSGATK